MCACEEGESCMYHAKMLKNYQTMWKLLNDLRSGKIDNIDQSLEVMDNIKYMNL